MSMKVRMILCNKVQSQDASAHIVRRGITLDENMNLAESLNLAFESIMATAIMHFGPAATTCWP